MEQLKMTSLSLVTGIFVGVIFTLFKFPLPAPPTFEAFMGIFGVWAGATAISRVSK